MIVAAAKIDHAAPIGLSDGDLPCRERLHQRLVGRSGVWHGRVQKQSRANLADGDRQPPR